MTQSIGPSPLLFLATSLACFRLTRLVTDDFIFRKLRKLPPAGSAARKGLACPFCVSFYFATMLAGFLVWRNMLTGLDAPLWGAGIWGASILFNQTFIKLSE